MTGGPDLIDISEEDLKARIEAVRGRMRPLEEQLATLRADRDVILTELRRRERAVRRQQRSEVKVAMREGELPTIVDLIEGGASGSFDDHSYNLRTGGQVRLGFPGARAQTVSFTDGRQIAQARDLAEAGRLYGQGWELGSPGRPGVRVHFTGTRQERLVDPSEVFASGSPPGVW